MADDQPISFGPFRLFPKARLLEKDGVAVHIGGRALEILILLAERPGEVVAKRELMKQVWADINVDDGSLRFHITGLRKALGDADAQYIKNVPGRGYCFAALPAPPERVAAAIVNNSSPTPSLPIQIAELIGRTEAIEKISADLSQYRMISIVGPGGIGKTSVALAVAHRQLSTFAGQVFFVDLGGLTDIKLVPATITSALGLAVSSQDPIPGLLAFLRGQQTLLILDSCEHVLETLAPLVEHIAREVPKSNILATSREAFRIENEHIFRLAPLEFPPQQASFNIADVSSYPAARLFIERTTASSDGLAFTENEAPLVAEICRRLDGIPLAIELAAGQVNAFGVAGTVSLLDSRLSLLWRGRRTTIPRHQTLSAALGWSYDLLSPVECATLRRLSVFSGTFALEGAIAVASYEGTGETEVVEAIATLLSKSLIATISQRPLRYRLLDTTRAFAREKLAESGEANQVARAHAEYFRDFLEDITGKIFGVESDRFLSHADQVANVRAALDWSFSDHGETAIGVDLAAWATQFFLELSLVTECHRWTQQALGRLASRSIDGHQEMRLHAALGASTMFTQGNTEAVRSSLKRSLQLAEHLDDRYWQLWLLRLLQLYHTRIGDFRGSVRVVEKAEAVAKALNDPASALYVQWVTATTQHMIGDQRKVVELCENAMVQNLDSQQSLTLRFGYDDRTLALVALARGLWLTGRPDRAVDVARYAVSEADRLQQPLSLSLAMLLTIPVFLWAGDWVNAESMIERFIDHTSRHALAPHHAVGIGLKGELLVRTGDVADGIDHLSRSQITLKATRYRMMSSVLGTAQAEAQTHLKRFEEALRLINESIAGIGERGESFDMPEMLRVKGQILRFSGHAPEAEACLQQSLELSRKQCALGWELRTAVTLGDLWLETGRATDACALIEPLYRRYEEGFERPDLIAAKRLLDTLN